MSDLSDSLLQQILETQTEMNKTLGQHGEMITGLRNELTGPSGKNGRIGKLEKAVDDLHDQSTFQKGLLYGINILLSLAAAFGYHHFIEPFFKK